MLEDLEALKQILTRFLLRAGYTMMGPSGMIMIQLSLFKVIYRIQNICRPKPYIIQLLINNQLTNYCLVLVYPEKLTISSTGGTAEKQYSVLGVYKITNFTYNTRPVWQSTAREDRYLFYKGLNSVIR